MFSSTKWVRSVVQLAAIVAVIAGATRLLQPTWFGAGSLAQHAAESSVRPPDPETTSSVLKLSAPQ